MRKAYYARPVSIYGSHQEDRDKGTIGALGFEPIDVNKQRLQEAYNEKGMEVFREIVKEADALFFRAFPDGKIGAGVQKEIEWADEAGLPVVELPIRMSMRVLTVEQTREYLAELGQR